MFFLLLCCTTVNSFIILWELKARASLRTLYLSFGFPPFFFVQQPIELRRWNQSQIMLNEIHIDTWIPYKTPLTVCHCSSLWGTRVASTCAHFWWLSVIWKGHSSCYKVFLYSDILKEHGCIFLPFNLWAVFPLRYLFLWDPGRASDQWLAL